MLSYAQLRQALNGSAKLPMNYQRQVLNRLRKLADLIMLNYNRQVLNM